MAGTYAEAALEALAAIIEDKDAPPAARVSAATAILDRAYGRPVQALQHSGAEGGPVDITAVVRRIVRPGE